MCYYRLICVVDINSLIKVGKDKDIKMNFPFLKTMMLLNFQ